MSFPINNSDHDENQGPDRVDLPTIRMQGSLLAGPSKVTNENSKGIIVSQNSPKVLSAPRANGRVTGSAQVASEVAGKRVELPNEINEGSGVAANGGMREDMAISPHPDPTPQSTNEPYTSKHSTSSISEHSTSKDHLALSTILDKAVSEINRFVYMRPDRMYVETVALWSCATHVFKYSMHFPRLVVTSPESDCGKSTLMQLMQFICRNAEPFSNATEAAILRRIGRSKGDATILLDDAENYVDGRHTSLLNGGYSRFGSKFLRCRKSKQGNYEDEEFDTYVPVAMARIGKVPVRSTESRCIEINVPKAKEEDAITRFIPTKHSDSLAAIRKQFEGWASIHGYKLKDYDPELPKRLINRNADIWRFMIAIADAAGGHWPSTVRKAAEIISLGVFRKGQTDTIRRDLQAALTLIRNSAREWPSWNIHETKTNKLRIPSKALLHYLGESSTKYKNITPDKLADQLQPFDVRPEGIKVVTKDGRTTIRGYKEEELQDIFTRYGLGDVDE